MLVLRAIRPIVVDEERSPGVASVQSSREICLPSTELFIYSQGSCRIANDTMNAAARRRLRRPPIAPRAPPGAPGNACAPEPEPDSFRDAARSRSTGPSADRYSPRNPHAARTSIRAHASWLGTSAHSTAACAPSPAPPMFTAGMPAPANTAASIQ
jgi:hypothetical protein